MKKHIFGATHLLKKCKQQKKKKKSWKHFLYEDGGNASLKVSGFSCSGSETCSSEWRYRQMNRQKKEEKSEKDKLMSKKTPFGGTLSVYFHQSCNIQASPFLNVLSIKLICGFQYFYFLRQNKKLSVAIVLRDMYRKDYWMLWKQPTLSLV